MSIKEQLIYKYMETKKEQSEIMAIMAICLFFTCMISCIFGDFMFAGLLAFCSVFFYMRYKQHSKDYRKAFKELYGYNPGEK